MSDSPTVETPPALPASTRETQARGERLSSLDLIRGIAILGILPVNMESFSGPAFSMEPAAVAITGPEMAIRALIIVFLEGKMMTMLSILFGVGLAIQADHAQAAGQAFAPYYRRRMLMLFFIGIAHGLLLFQFDILNSYAVVGFIVLFLLGTSARVRTWVTSLSVAWCYVSCLLMVAIMMAFGPEWAAAPVPAGEADYFSEEMDIRIFRTGTFGEMVVARSIYLLIMAIVFWLESGWYILACMLIGIALARRGVFHDPSAHRPFLRKMIVWGLILCVPFEAAGVISYLRDPAGMTYFYWIILGGLPLGLAYLALLIFWSQSRRLSWLQYRLRKVGRMALTNYLLQSILCGFVFYSYGLRWYGIMSPLMTYGVVLVVWMILFAVSRLWLERFPKGPAEWFWRKLAGKAR